ncbi:MAG: carboxymuconolactone decarboxylase family protein [Dehalococcoidia bacterium]|jgi:4-carboxymuconolactone decarboxylase
MKQDIRMAAILERDGRLFLVRATPGAPWELPGGALPPENDDVDAEMDAILQRLGVMAPAIEEDFLQTHFIPSGDGQIVYNVYAATGWTGDPAAQPGVGAGWFSLEDMRAVAMDDHVRNAVLEAYGMREPDDQDAKIMAALAGIKLDEEPAPPPAFSDRRSAGLDVLRTLTASDPVAAADRMRKAQPELAGDIIDFALGEVWAHPALDRRTRSLLALAMIAAQGHTGGALSAHISGALNHGASPDEVVQTMRMVAVYAGFPAALGAWAPMEKVFEQRGIPRPGRLQ